MSSNWFVTHFFQVELSPRTNSNLPYEGFVFFFGCLFPCYFMPFLDGFAFLLVGIIKMSFLEKLSVTLKSRLSSLWTEVILLFFCSSFTSVNFNGRHLFVLNISSFRTPILSAATLKPIFSRSEFVYLVFFRANYTESKQKITSRTGYFDAPYAS